MQTEHISSWKDVVSGILQGSIMGPTLFVIYINDMPDVVQGAIKLFGMIYQDV